MRPSAARIRIARRRSAASRRRRSAAGRRGGCARRGRSRGRSRRRSAAPRRLPAPSSTAPPTRRPRAACAPSSRREGSAFTKLIEGVKFHCPLKKDGKRDARLPVHVGAEGARVRPLAGHLAGDGIVDEIVLRQVLLDVGDLHAERELEVAEAEGRLQAEVGEPLVGVDARRLSTLSSAGERVG